MKDFKNEYVSIQDVVKRLPKDWNQKETMEEIMDTLRKIVEDIQNEHEHTSCDSTKVS